MKNALCVPHHNPEHPSDWFKQSYINYTNQDKIFSAIGSEFSSKWRVSIGCHMSPEQRERAKNFKCNNKKILYEKFKSFGQQRDHYDQFNEKMKSLKVTKPKEENHENGCIRVV